MDDNPRVLIISMRGWGELGNYLCAQQLQAFINKKVEIPASIIVADDYLQFFIDIGNKIKTLTKEAESSDKRNQAYKALLENTAQELETYDYIGCTELTDFLEKIYTFNPTVVISTKGIISKLISQALSARKQPKMRLVNYVTNHGHFQFPAHLDSNVTEFITRLPEASAYIKTQQSIVNDPQIHEVGFISSFDVLASIQAPAKISSRPDVTVIVSNRGDSRYLELTQLILENSELDVVFISINNEDEIKRIKIIADKYNSSKTRLIIFNTFSQQDYFKLLAEVGGRASIYVGKGSINTLLEALISGIPVFGIRSGLPMEEWGGGYLQAHGIGNVYDHPGQLFSDLMKTITDSEHFMDLNKNVFEHNFKLTKENVTRDVLKKMIYMK